MASIGRGTVVALVILVIGVPATAGAQIAFEKSGYYLSVGDSVAAGQGALPVTHGFAYQLYDRGVFGRKQKMDFGNIAIKGATTDDVQLFQVPQALCIQPPRIAMAPSVITVVAGANDLLVYVAANGIPQDPLTVLPELADAIAAKVDNIIRSLVFGVAGLPAHCAANGIPGVIVLVANYYSFNHPDPNIDFLLDLALQSFGASLAARVAQIQAELAAEGKTARVGYVDSFAAVDGPGLLLITRRNGFDGALDFEIHPTNAGHTAIAREFERVWETIQ